IAAGNLHAYRSRFARACQTVRTFIASPKAGVAGDHFRGSQCRAPLPAYKPERQVCRASHGGENSFVRNGIRADMKQTTLPQELSVTSTEMTGAAVSTEQVLIRMGMIPLV